MRIIIHNFHHSFHHRGRRGHRGYSGGNIFTHSSDTDCLSVFGKSVESFSLYLLSPFTLFILFILCVLCVLCGENSDENSDEPPTMFTFAFILLL